MELTALPEEIGAREKGVPSGTLLEHSHVSGIRPSGKNRGLEDPVLGTKGGHLKGNDDTESYRG